MKKNLSKQQIVLAITVGTSLAVALALAWLFLPRLYFEFILFGTCLFVMIAEGISRRLHRRSKRE